MQCRGLKQRGEEGLSQIRMASGEAPVVIWVVGSILNVAPPSSLAAERIRLVQ